jgi:hypothetical protein
MARLNLRKENKMKTRNGFVSNSSSSSFVIVTSKDEHEKALKKLSEEQKSLIENSFSEDKKLGLVMFAYHKNEESMYAYEASGKRTDKFKRRLLEASYEEDNCEKWEEVEGAIDSYVNAVKHKMTVSIEG